MIKRFKPKSEFNRNVLTLMTGTTIAQAIPIAISPILTRIYTPNDFGLLALFIAITSIFGSIANGRYELAIMLPKKDEDAINIFALGMIITSCISLALLILVIFLNDYIATLFNNSEFGFWLYFVPITVFFIGLFNILNYFNTRRKSYKDIANAMILKSIVLAVVQLLIGFFQKGVVGLIGGQILSQMIANLRLIANIGNDKSLIYGISKARIISQAKRYIDFPKYSMLATLANVLSQHLTNILISLFFSVATLGFYSIVQRVLGMPSALIGRSISQVFFQEAAREKELTGSAAEVFNTTTKKLIIIGLPSFGLLYFIAEDLFAFVFGEQWRIAGEFAEILIPLFFVRFIVSVVSGVNTVFEKQKAGLYINILLLMGMLLTFYASDYYQVPVTGFLYMYSTVLSLEYILFYSYYYRLSKGSK